MPPRRAAAASRRRGDGETLFRGSSPGDDETADGDDMQVDALLSPASNKQEQDTEETAAEKLEQPRSGNEDVEDEEPQLEGEGINMPLAPGHGVVDGDAEEQPAPIEPAVGIEQEQTIVPDQTVDGAGDASAPVTVEGKAPATSNTGADAVEDDVEENNGVPLLAKSDATSVEDASTSSSGLLASLPVYYNKTLASTSKIQILQFPNFPRKRALPIPASARERGLSPAMRYRPRSKRLEMELPLDQSSEHYDIEKGDVYAEGAAAGDAIGAGPGGNRDANGPIIPEVKREAGESHANGRTPTRRRLEKMRLESTLIPHRTKYMMGVIRDGALHLTPVDAVHQLRPSMHYIDHLDMINHKNKRSAAAAEAEEDDALGRVRAAPRVQNLNVSMRAPAEKDFGGGGSGSGSANSGGAGAGGGAASGAARGSKPMDGRDQLMAAEREAESENWMDLAYKPSESDEAQKVFDAQLFATSKTRLQCLTRPREFLPSM